jgi:transcriptional regulator with XRE-family HTH domain
MLVASTPPTESDRDQARGGRIRQLRRQHNLTQAQVASSVGVTGRAYYEWENRGGPLSRGNLHLLAKALSTSPEYLLTGVDGPAGLQDRVAEVENEVQRLMDRPVYPPGSVDVGELASEMRHLVQRIERLENTGNRLATLIEQLLLAEDEADLRATTRRRPRRQATDG